MAWVRTSAESAENALMVCTGAFIVGRLGMLDGLDATIWHAAVTRLAEQFPKARVQPGRRFIDNGKVITTAWKRSRRRDRAIANEREEPCPRSESPDRGTERCEGCERGELVGQGRFELPTT